MDYIERSAGKAISRIIDSFPVILVTGPRQVGKTTLLQNLPATRALPYISFDKPSEVLSAKADPHTFLQLHQGPVIFDEIQYVPELFRWIKIEADTKKTKGMYYLTGSQQFHLMKNVSESLAGRIGILQLLGLSLREIADQGSGNIFDLPFIPTEEYLATRNKNAKAYGPKEIWNNIFQGSFPAIISGYSRREAFYDSYVRTYVERDVRALTQVGDELQFIQFITVAASRTGQMLNYQDMSRDVGISEPTAKKWLSILITSGLVYLLTPYSANVGKRVVKTPKLYFLDTGLAAYLTKWTSPEVMMQGAMAGAFFETFVIAEILKSYYNAGSEPALFYYRDKDQKEIDLLVMENGYLYPLEIKKTATPKRQDASAFAVLKNINGMKIGIGGIICTDTSLGLIDKDRYIIPVGFV
ncbi:ATP-binding protein [Leadbettera azotonutricia]|uniref:ATPase n=1 Tax=Leadbettera azotonutricia (strain ATCC BAA-888 / DSM 13862 / ZAS-9) TaxID=545695 RepID=F5YEQ9_LEAAZ|nr:ATP-binding protein [Leadbettera azotonutricia]AEF80686.1 ATPase [Leadbettera azotonutricia ZAS-9]